MILAIDVDYRGPKAMVAGICFDNWPDNKATKIYHSVVSDIEEYEPGSFYRREMPCILQLLQEHSLIPDAIVIDGFVYLDDKPSPGLGMHLFNALNQKIPVIGVAKNPFKGIPPETALLRGNSSRPLYITAAGIGIDEAKNKVLSMHGKHRIPTLLKEADRECRKKQRT